MVLRKKEKRFPPHFKAKTIDNVDEGQVCVEDFPEANQNLRTHHAVASESSWTSLYPWLLRFLSSISIELNSEN